MRLRLRSLFQAILLSLPATAACGGSGEPSSSSTTTVPSGQSGQGGAGQAGAGQGGAGAGQGGASGAKFCPDPAMSPCLPGQYSSLEGGPDGCPHYVCKGTPQGGAGGGGGAPAAGSGGAAGESGGAGQGGAAGAGEGGAGQAGSAGAGGSVIGPEFASVECFQAGLAGQIKVDSIEVFSAEIQLWGDPTPPAWASLFADGKPCGSAPDPAACAAKVDEAKKTPTSALSSEKNIGNAPSSPRELIVVTSGAEVRVVASLEELAALLGPLDSLEKLTLWARYRFANGCSIKVKKVEGGFEVWVLHTLVSDCPITYENQLYSVTTAGEATKLASAPDGGSGACAGRRPEGLLPAPPRALPALGAFFSKMAYLEAASVEAFSRLHDELATLGAPADLLDECVTSAVDEVRHAEDMRGLAERFGGSLDEPSIAPARGRSAVEIALENAVEGCVRETYGALEASYQAEHAGDDEVRSVMATIARDETAHAALSWRLHAWFEDKLDEADLRAIEGAMAEAIEALRGELRRPREASLVTVAGLPDEATALALLGELEGRLLLPGLPRAA